MALTHKKLSAILFFVSIASLAFFVFASSADAANPFDFKFPIAELGGCNSLEACRAFCDNPANKDACIAFAESRGLIKKEVATKARQFSDFIAKGDVPVAGCTTENDCKNLCILPENREACNRWAAAHGFITPSPKPKPSVSPTQLPPINRQKALEVITKLGGGPGGCKTMEACGQYCSKPENQKECFEFAKKYGLYSQDYANTVQKAINGPGGCVGDACKIFCSKPENREVCLKFAEEKKLLSPEQIEKERKLDTLTGPGGCRGLDCKTYCSDPIHREECYKFGVDNGLIKPEAQRIQPTYKPTPIGTPIVNGPGGCTTMDQCRVYCSDINNKVECDRFKATLVPTVKPYPSGEIRPCGAPTDSITSSVPQIPCKPTPTYKPASSGTVCPQVISPVCTTENQSFPNECYAKLAGKTIAHSGKCEGPINNTATPRPSVSFVPQEPATKCAASGGTWNGATCIFDNNNINVAPPPPPSFGPTSFLGKFLGFLSEPFTSIFK